MRWEAFRSVLSFSLLLPVLGARSSSPRFPWRSTTARGPTCQFATPDAGRASSCSTSSRSSSLLRADGSLDAVRYPGFATAGARDGIWYRKRRAPRVHDAGGARRAHREELPRPGNSHARGSSGESLHARSASNTQDPRIRAGEPASAFPSRYCPRTGAEVSSIDRQRGLVYDTYVGVPLRRVLPGLDPWSAAGYR